MPTTLVKVVRQVMSREPYASARRVFRIVDDDSDHRGQRSIGRLQRRWRNLTLIQLPVHASWLNQVETYHSIVQRKVLDRNDVESTAEIARTLNQFERHYNEIAEPFDWNFHPPRPRPTPRSLRRRAGTRPARTSRAGCLTIKRDRSYGYGGLH